MLLLNFFAAMGLLLLVSGLVAGFSLLIIKYVFPKLEVRDEEE